MDNPSIGVRGRALEAFEEIGRNYNQNFDESESKADRGKLEDMNRFGRLLVEGGVMTAKEVYDEIEKLRKRLKHGGDEGKRTQIEVMNDWLNGREMVQ